MKRFRLSILLIFLLLAGCQSGLERSEQKYLAEGYRKLSPYAYIREDPEGGSFSTLSEGDLGEAIILGYLRDQEHQLRRALDQRRARGPSDQTTEVLERRLRSTEHALESLIKAFR